MFCMKEAIGVFIIIANEIHTQGLLMDEVNIEKKYK